METTTMYPVTVSCQPKQSLACCSVKGSLCYSRTGMACSGTLKLDTPKKDVLHSTSYLTTADPKNLDIFDVQECKKKLSLIPRDA